MNFISNGLNWLFGRNTWKQFFSGFNSYRLGSKGAVYLDTDAPYQLYNSIPQLQQVVRKKALMFSNMALKLVDKEGNEVKDEDLQKLLNNPNFLQSQNEFLRQYKEQEQVYGNQFLYKNKPSRLNKYPVSIMPISPAQMQPVTTGRLYDQTELTGVVKEYQYEELGNKRTFKVEDILWSKINDLDSPLIGTSPLKSLQYPLTNTKYAYDYLNVISGEKGGIGLLSTAPAKDMAGSLPSAMTTDEKKKLQSTFQNNYGIGTNNLGEDKMRIHITDAPLTWTPMSYPTGQLLLLEQIDANFLTIIDHFGLNVNIFSSKNQTFENVKNAIIQCYQDTIIPEADQFTQAFGKFIGIEEKYKLVADYSHLSILQSDKSREAVTFSTASSALNQLVSGGILSKEQAAFILQNEYGKVLS